MSELTCRVTLSHRDFIMANHRVHGTSVLPGVAFLDLVLRALAGAGEDPARAAIRNVVFTEAVVTTGGYDREIRCVIRPDRGGNRAARAGRPGGSPGGPRARSGGRRTRRLARGGGRGRGRVST